MWCHLSVWRTSSPTRRGEIFKFLISPLYQFFFFPLLWVKVFFKVYRLCKFTSFITPRLQTPFFELCSLMSGRLLTLQSSSFLPCFVSWWILLNLLSPLTLLTLPLWRNLVRRRVCVGTPWLPGIYTRDVPVAGKKVLGTIFASKERTVSSVTHSLRPKKHI